MASQRKVYIKLFSNGTSYTTGDFNTNNASITTETKRYKISMSLKNPLVYLLNSCQMSRTSYILCPLYREGDYQLGISESYEEKDKYMRETIKRGLMEEVGIIYNTYMRPTQSTICINISDTQLNVEKDKSMKVGKQDGNKKAFIVVYGEITDFSKKYLEKQIVQYSNEDNIVGVVLLPVENVNSAIKIIKKRQEKYKREWQQKYNKGYRFSFEGSESSIKNKKGDLFTEDEDVKCPICKEYGIDMRLSPCHHKFHWDCVLYWYYENKTCPLCEKEVVMIQDIDVYQDELTWI